MIEHAVSGLALFAMRQESAGVWGRFDHQRPSFGTHEILILVGAVLLPLIGLLISQGIARRRRRDFWLNSESRLFGELSRAHQLDHSNRRLLKRLAAARGLKSAAVLFVEPDHFDVSNVPPILKTSANELRQVRHRLFD